MENNGNSFFNKLNASVEDAVKELDATESEISEIIDSLLKEAPNNLLEIFKKSSPEMIEHENRSRDSFQVGNYQRWKEPLDLLTILWRISQEAGEAHAHEGPGEADPLTFDTLAHLHPRALLITSEIMCLLEGGFADAALSRWRSLHEVVVVAMFIAKHGRKAAHPYRLNMWFDNYKRAINYNIHMERAKLDKIEDHEMAKIRQMRDGAKSELGRDLDGDWGWAADALDCKGRVNFLQIEQNVQMDHWRPRYKWACQHIHAGFVDPKKLLGMSESETFMFQVGASNSGLSDPIQMTAISLMQMFTTFLFFPDPNFDRVVYCDVARKLVDEICETAIITRDNTLKEAREQKSRN